MKNVKTIIAVTFFLAFILLSAPQAMALVFTDNFNDNSLDPFWWTASASGTSAVSETGQHILMTQGSSGSASIKFNIPVKGDFTADIAFTAINWPTYSYERSGISSTFGGPVEFVNSFSGTYSCYLTHFGDGVRGVIPTTATSGGLRFARTGTTVSGYYRQGTSSWTLINSYSNPAYSADTNIYLSIWPLYQGGGVNTKIAFDDFSLNAPSTPSPVPEPATMALFGIGGVAMALIRKKK